MEEKKGCLGKSVLLGGVCLFALVSGFSTCQTVEEGHRGFRVRFGKVISEEPLQPGIYAKIPFLDSIYSMDIRTKLAKSETQALTSDSQPVVIQFALNHNLSPDQVIPMYKTVGFDYERVLIENTTLNVIQKIVGQTKADDLVNKKAEAISKMEVELAESLKESGINVTNFGVPNLTFSQAFTESIERKETARQDSLREEYNTARCRELAQQKIEAARGEAESMKLVADAEAYAIRQRAEAAASNSQALEFEIISKWDGRLPVVTGGGQNILDIKTLLSDATGRPVVQKTTPRDASEKVENTPSQERSEAPKEQSQGYTQPQARQADNQPVQIAFHPVRLPLGRVHVRA